MPTSKVSAVNVLSEDVFELVLERDGVDFQPGNCFAISDSNGVSRPYSASSDNTEPYLRFVIRRMPGGAVSEWLATRVPGDEIELSSPFGWFRPGYGDEPGDPSVLIATGTGIAPFLSALRSFPDLKPAICLYGVRSLADAVGLDYLRDRCPFRLCVSREEAPPHHHGRVTDLLSEIPRRKRTNYYLCGLDAMVREVGQWLERRGVHYTRIHREVFFNA
ncbi:MAG: FAD-binding oxidoreductase [Planctomycetota bacterium]